MLVATLLSTDGSSAQIDLEGPSALEPGDRGHVYYELLVNGEPRRIDVGGVEVAAVREWSATLTAPDGNTLRAGYQVEFEVAVEVEKTPVDMAFIPAGLYTVGLEVSEAAFFNQTPRHSVDLAGYWIDMHPAAGADPFSRRFMAPGKRNTGLGFRCAKDAG